VFGFEEVLVAERDILSRQVGIAGGEQVLAVETLLRSSCAPSFTAQGTASTRTSCSPGSRQQTTRLTPAQQEILTAAGVPPPPRITALQPA
jgi:hypothetical protein